MKAVSLILAAIQLVIQVNSHLTEYVKHFEGLEYDRDGLMNRHHRLRRSNEEDKSLELSFTAFNRPFNLLLQPDSATHTSYELQVDGKPHPKGLSDSFYYTGYDQQDGSYVHGSLAYGVFDGTIHGNDEVYYIEPSNRYYTNVSHHSVIYRQSDAIQYTTTAANGDSTSSTPSFCGVGKNSNGHPTVKRSTTTQRQMNTRQDNSDGKFDKTKTKCELNIVVDEYFYNAITDDSLSESHKIAQAVATVKSIVLAGSNNFERTDFDGDYNPDHISFSIRSIEVLTDDSQTNLRITDEFLGVEALLNAFSKDDYDKYCLSYLFTFREFENGVLGLAFIAEDDSSSAGLCANKRTNESPTYNTGLVTLRNYNIRVPRLVSEVTFTHEAGHNFGAQHDTTNECVDRENNNNYVMFPQASDGRKSNNNRFSPCSIRQMKPILQDRGQNKMNGCFKHFDDNCGNLLIESEEDCDCGFDFNKTSGICFSDRCCNGTTCTLINNAECSPQQGPCCNDKCQIIPLFDDVLCSDETECAYNQTCNGTSPYCPEADPIEPDMNQNGVPCNDGNNYCKNGECIGSICVALQLEDCECTEKEYLCHVCCMRNSICTSTFKIAEDDETARSLLPNGNGTVIGVGYPCDMSQGYCDFFNTCRFVNNDGPIKRLSNFLRGTSVGRLAVNSIGRNWWVLLAVGAGIAIFAFVFVLVNHFYSTYSKRAKRKLSKKKKNSVRPTRVSVRPKPSRVKSVPTLESYL